MGPSSVTPQQLADKLNSASTDLSSKEAWDIVAVHVWTMTLKDIQTAISLLQPHVKVVTPTQYIEFLSRYHPN